MSAVRGVNNWHAAAKRTLCGITRRCPLGNFIRSSKRTNPEWMNAALRHAANDSWEQLMREGRGENGTTLIASSSYMAAMTKRCIAVNEQKPFIKTAYVLKKDTKRANVSQQRSAFCPTCRNDRRQRANTSAELNRLPQSSCRQMFTRNNLGSNDWRRSGATFRHAPTAGMECVLGCRWQMIVIDSSVTGWNTPVAMSVPYTELLKANFLSNPKDAFLLFDFCVWCRWTLATSFQPPLR